VIVPADVRLRNVRLAYDEFCDLDESGPIQAKQQSRSRIVWPCPIHGE
jgi:hypothetical protein